MPIRAELRRFYRGPAWEEKRRRILVRAWNRCEQCGKPNRTEVRTVTRGTYMYWCKPEGFWTDERGREWPNLMLDPSLLRTIRVVLTVAHLNHVPGDDRDENLKALCQWCHLNYDKLHHKETRCDRKDSGRPILVLVKKKPPEAQLCVCVDASAHA